MDEEVVERFETFFKLKHHKEILRAARHYPATRSIVVDFEDIETFDYRLAEELLRNPARVLPAADRAVRLIASTLVEDARLTVRFKNIPNQTLVADLGRSTYISKFVSFEGVMVSISEIKQRCQVAAFECKRCGHVMYIEQEDGSDELREPYFCDECGRRGPFRLLKEESVYKDVQLLKVQEHFEKAQGTQPRQVTVIIEDDLTQERVWGTHVKVSGILEIRHDKRRGRKTRDAKKYVVANYVEFEDERSRRWDFTPEEIREFKQLAEDPNIHREITRSIAPHIIGLDRVKEGVGLWLFGAPPEKLPDGNTQRGDSHILLIGDPATAKSDILEFVEANFKALRTSGPGATKVGLSAAAVRDPDTGEWTLRAGPLVLADGWLCLIDEFEKMSDEDRKSLHEPLEQQKVSISKAGIVANFRARCGVLAAANPKYGRFDIYRPLIEQFNIPDTILSRFDLIFVVRDTPDHDREIARSILNSGTYEPEIDLDLLYRYVVYARQNIHPVLSEEAKEYLENYYIRRREILLRIEDAPVPITPRQLVGLKRLAKARARQRLSNVVTLEDVKAVTELFDYTLQEAGVSVDSGIDIDKIMMGVGKDQRKEMHTILRIIMELEKDFGTAKLEEIIDAAREYGIDEKRVKAAIEVLRQQGDIFEPKYEHYKTT